MLIQELFRRAASRCNQVTQEMAAFLAPAIMRELVGIPALGGSGDPTGIADEELRALLESLPPFSEQDRANFSTKGFDQSLATHLINGLFAGLRLAERLPEHKRLDEVEQQVWALGYTVHDYTKAYGRKVAAGLLPDIRRLVTHLGTLLDFPAFMSNWHDYLDDIVFIAQNIQTVQGANLNLRDYHCRLDRRQRETLRLLGSVTDLLVHITAPSDVVYRDLRGRDLWYNLGQKVDNLFGYEDAPRLTYHKLLEVRGLLSNLINNAITEELRAQEYEPFLFFPEGVIYLAPRTVKAAVSIDGIAENVWRRIAGILTGANSPLEEADDDEDEEEQGEREGGLQMRRTKDYMKGPSILYELLSVEALMEEGQRTALNIPNSRTAARLGAEQAEEQGIDARRLPLKEKDDLYTRLGKEWAAQQGLPVDARVDQLAEFLVFLRHRIFAPLFPKLPDVPALLLRALNLEEEVTPERAERQRGGTPTGWFFAAACYIKRHSDLNPYELEEVMNGLRATVLEAIASSGFSTGREGTTARIFKEYLQHIIELDGALLNTREEAIEERFRQELQRYVRGKERNKPLCSLCASPYEAQKQDKSVVLFKPQQYSNKARLDTSRLVRGICPICALEMLLRQVRQGLKPGKAQDQHMCYLYLYPTYFFTAETAEVVKQFQVRLQQLNLSRLIFSHLEKTGFHARDLFSYEDFLIDEEGNVPSGRGRQNAYSEQELAALFFMPFQPRSAGSKLTETDTWIVPTFFALALPLLLGVKCVATTSFTLLYHSASDFQETTVLDAAHPFTGYLLEDRARIDRIPKLVERLLRVYSPHLDVYREGMNNHWGQLTSVAKDLATDPLYVFQYYDRAKRRAEARQAGPKGRGKRAEKPSPPATRAGGGISPLEQQRYMGIYYAIGGTAHMGFIGELVETYMQFYRAKSLDSAYAVLRPLSTAIDVVVESDPKTDIDDLRLLVAGAINDDQERVRSRQAEGNDPIVFNEALGSYPARLALSRQKIEEFASLFLEKCFRQYCDSDRALLRERTNRIRSAARFYYLTHLTHLPTHTSDQTSAAAAVVPTTSK